MIIIAKLIADYAFVFYILLGIVGVILLRAIQIALKERSRSIFDLERERATARLNQNIFYFLVVCFVGGGIFYTVNNLIAGLALPEVTPTPTAISFLPSTPTSHPLLPTPTPTVTPTSRPTQPPLPSGGPNLDAASPSQPSAEVVPINEGIPPACPSPGVQISQPFDGATVSGVIQLTGTAQIDNFSYYKVEFRVPGRDWSFIESYESPGTGVIASWNTATVPPGNYEFRLVVVDITGNFPKPCEIQLNVVR